MHVNPLGADARLAGVGHTTPERSLGGLGQVGVLVDDQRVLAAGLDQHRREVFRARGHDLLAGRAGAGERELVDGRGAQRVASLAETGDDLEHRTTANNLGELVGEPLPDPGGVFAGLEHHGIAGSKRVRDGTARREHRVVPRPDHTDDAERLVLDGRGLVGHQQTRLDLVAAEHLLGVLGGPGDVVDGEHDLKLRVTGRLAGLQVRQLRELGDATGDDAAPGEEVFGALLERQRSPPVGAFTGALHRGVHVCLAADGVHSDDIAVGGVERLEGCAGRGCPGRWCFDRGGHRDSLIRSAHFSPTIMVGALVLPRGMRGITEASATRRPSTP